MTILTPHHARLFAHELQKRCASDSIEKLVAVLADAQIDLNPHQIEAALFAFQSPFSRGAILAGTLPEKLERQRSVRTLETKRDEAWRAFDQASRDIDRQERRTPSSTRSPSGSSKPPNTPTFSPYDGD